LEQARELTPEEQAAALAYRREQEAALAPTGTSGSRSLETPQSAVRTPNSGAPPLPDVSQILAHSQAVQPPAAPSDDYTVQNMQARKEAFMTTAAGRQTDDYLRSIRSAPLSRFEIKAGWEIPAILEQSLNSDLPGELKALVTSNVYDTATGMYLLIPHGSR
jgi:type IV secretion system protein VirB10